MSRKKTHEEFVKEIEEKYGYEYTVLGQYINAKTKVTIRHNCDKCGNHEWMVLPSNILKRSGCPICCREKIANDKRKTHEQFLQEIKEKYGNEYTILDVYKKNNTKILVRHNCDKCHNYQWKVVPSSLLQGYGCPVCSGREAKLGVNTIWDTDRWMCNLGVSEEDAKRYKSRSTKKITVKCPECGREKKIAIHQIYGNKSISCSCGDGKSYPEKFVMNLLEQLDVDFKTEYSPEWVKPKRYDFYIKDNNCIIEANGLQHYKEGFITLGGKVLKQEQINDKFKKEVALKNGIRHYIELDCRESNLEWIRNSILKSELNKLFDLSKIDWNKCAEFANKNIVKEVCDYWNKRKEGETTGDLINVFKMARVAIINCLKKGTKLGWCEYDSKEEMKKCGYKNGRKSGKKVEIFKDGQSLGIFSSCTELERQSEKVFGVRLFDSLISNVCNGKQKQHKGFTFKYVEEDNNLNISKIA